MGNLLRRRELILPSASPSEWDDVWEYTDGAPTVDGWVQSGSGSGASVSTGYRTRGVTYDKADVLTTSGVLEAHFQIINERSTMVGVRAGLRIGNASNAVVVLFNSYSSAHNIYLPTHKNSGWAAASDNRNGTQIGTFTLGGWYKVKLTIDGSVGTVEINDEVVADNIDTAGLYLKGGLRFSGSSSSYFGSIWQYVKYKDNS